MTDKAYGEVLGAFIVGPHATDLISEILGVKASEGTMNELSNIIQPHPSLSEAMARARMHTLEKPFICDNRTNQ